MTKTFLKITFAILLVTIGVAAGAATNSIFPFLIGGILGLIGFIIAIKEAIYRPETSKESVKSAPSKSEELREAKSLLEDGVIDDDEFKEMKKEILGK